MDLFIDYESLRYLKLKPSHQEIFENSNLTPEHAEILLDIPSEEIREKLLLSIAKNKLNPAQSKSMYYTIIKKARIKGNKLPSQIYLNTIDNVVEKISNKGVNITSSTKETTNYFECIIRIPK